MSFLRVNSLLAIARGFRPVRGTSSRPRTRRFLLGEGPEHLEGRCLLTGTNLADATPLGPISTTPTQVTGTIQPGYNTNALYVVNLVSGETIQVVGEPAAPAPGIETLYLTTGIYDAGGELLYYPGKDPYPPEPSQYVQNGSQFFQFTASANGPYYIYVSREYYGAPSPLQPLYTLGNNPTPYTLIVYSPSTTPVNKPPIAINVTATTAEDQPVTLDVLANDSDPNGGTVTLTSLSSAPGGSANVSAHGGHLTETPSPGNPSHEDVVYTPPADFSGQDTFVYTITNTAGLTATATATITVTPVAPPPPPPPVPTVSFLMAEQTVLLRPGGPTKTTETLNVGLSAASDSPVVVSYHFDAGASTATLGKDFTGPASGELTILAGQTQASIGLDVLNRHGNQSDELTYTITSVRGADLGSITKTMLTVSDIIFGRAEIKDLYLQASDFSERIIDKVLQGKLTLAAVSADTTALLGIGFLAKEYDLIYGGDSIFDATFDSLETLLVNTIAILQKGKPRLQIEQYTGQLDTLTKNLQAILPGVQSSKRSVGKLVESPPPKFPPKTLQDATTIAADLVIVATGQASATTASNSLTYGSSQASSDLDSVIALKRSLVPLTDSDQALIEQFTDAYTRFKAAFDKLNEANSALTANLNAVKLGSPSL
jgi:Bacterial Ig domain